MSKSFEKQLAMVAERQHGVFARSDVLQIGLADAWLRHRVTDGNVRRVRYGAYRFAGTPLTWRGELLAALWAGGPRARASHRSSAAMLGLTGGRTDVIEIMCPRWRRARHDDLIVHETKAFEDSDTVVIDGIPCTAAARTLLDLGAVLSESSVEYALDHALRIKLVTVPELVQMLDRVAKPGRNGAGILRHLLETRTPGRAAESVPERRMVRMLVRHGLPEPVLQYELSHQGRFIARVDAAYPQWRVAIEYESFEHHMGEVAHIRDNRRLTQLQRYRWHYVAVTNADLQDGCREIAETIHDFRRAAS